MTKEERAALIAQGWTPPVAVDPDLGEAKRIAENWDEIDELVYAGIKRGRALAAEAKPGMVWVKNSGLSTPDGVAILTINECGYFDITLGCRLSSLEEDVTHYAVITPPAEDAA